MRPILSTLFGFYLIPVLFLPVPGAAQGTIIVGSLNTKDYHPFGISSTNLYTGEYQQIYASTAFPNTISISGVAFSSTDPCTADYDLTVSLGTTARTPGAPGTTFVSSLTPVFSGDSPQVFTAAPDFDLVLNFPVPFTYNPAEGNLVLDVVVASANFSGGGAYFFAQDNSPLMGTLWTAGNRVVGTANYGLVTEFAIPEPSTYALLGLGGLLISARLFGKARKRSVSENDI